jgi:hypothetical protein
MLNHTVVNDLIELINLVKFSGLEFLDGFRTNSTTFQQQDRDKLLNLASSLSSFFDHAGITNLAQSRIAREISNQALFLPHASCYCLDDQSTANRLPVIPNRSVNNVRLSFFSSFLLDLFIVNRSIRFQ